ncbi:OLC1v1032441C1 [Oldenlandia corymbosa var. corymbosa]|uniref:OLC1v1032441C1 n=1 Tax=Oldenlandia corymbosa var. corymbosa TaxID=529605 RepID=A0AAV1CP24_OLDCO|nr:OLC1v1032441C1 [Oldenlandia corymbosa var. corymbosa]
MGALCSRIFPNPNCWRKKNFIFVFKFVCIALWLSTYVVFSPMIEGFYRLRLYHRRLPSKRFHGVPIFSCLVGESSGIGPGSGESSIPSDSSEKAEIDLKLPRRSLLVTFTCNACGERSAKLVNRVAYERGTVFVQCAGCFQHHKLVDNLGLVVEYNFREESDADSTADSH